ncbi:Golgi traffic protein SFT2 [Cordyceps militaris CM01]|uniref:Protein transport protein SFT2 n=1 Tax=Cordyceps militaris (strain CM01) TaxID=983644 RepID=G3J377_CORMM|nr:Golgi traffic protein SFT2 [Cordyceps militaris CM01]EGX96458.1 Golgi traffic protein SFT2 [Cordyceps militaris CM01]
MACMVRSQNWHFHNRAWANRMEPTLVYVVGLHVNLLTWLVELVQVCVLCSEPFVGVLSIVYSSAKNTIPRRVPALVLSTLSTLGFRPSAWDLLQVPAFQCDLQCPPSYPSLAVPWLSLAVFSGPKPVQVAHTSASTVTSDPHLPIMCHLLSGSPFAHHLRSLTSYLFIHSYRLSLAATKASPYSINSLGWSRATEEPVNTSRETGFFSSIQNLNPFQDRGYLQLPTHEASPGAPLPAPTRREEEEGWFIRGTAACSAFPLPSPPPPPAISACDADGTPRGLSQLTLYVIVSRWDRLLVFAACNIAALACFVICFTLFPIVATRPRKFVLLWTVGSGLFLASFAAVMGPMNYIYHLLSTPRLPFTAAYFGSIIMTLVFAIKLLSHGLNWSAHGDDVWCTASGILDEWLTALQPSTWQSKLSNLSYSSNTG